MNLHVPIKKEDRSTRVAVKQEFPNTFIKKEPKMEAKCQTSFIKPCPPNGLLRPTNIKKRASRRNMKRHPTEKYRHSNRFRGNQFAKAVHVHRNLTAKDPDSLSGKQLDSLTWAEKVIVRENLKRNAQRANFLDIPSVDLTDHNSPILIEDNDISDTLQLAVVDFGTPGGRYSIVHGNLIQKAFGKAVVKHTLKNIQFAVPSYGSPSWNDGVIVLDCKNEYSYDFAKTAVGNMKLWQGSVLKAIPPERNPFMSKARLDVPDLGIVTNEVLDVLRCQNPLVNMKTWKIIDEDVSRASFRGLTILVSEPPAALLQNRQLNLFFGAGEVSLKLLGCNWTDDL